MTFVLNGTISIEGEKIHTSELATLTTEGKTVALKVEKDTKLLFMSGKPINGVGPFLMNTKEEIYQAYSDFNSGNSSS